MKFSDILDLARQGYKPSDIRELLSMDTETKSEPENEPENEPETKSEPENEPETKSEPETEPETKPETKPEPDYKKMYEETLKRLDALQKANQRQPIDHHEDTVDSIMRDAFY